VEARERLYRQFAAEEVASALRHRLVNKISAVGALAFHLRRQLPPETPRAALDVLPMLEGEVAQASQTLDLHFVLRPGPAGPVPVGELAEGVLAAAERPAGVELVGPGVTALRWLGDRGELELALRCLVENAVEAVADRGTVTLRAREAQPRFGVAMAALEIADDGPGMGEPERRQALEPFFTTKPGRLGIGLNVAARIALRWRGTVELAEAGTGLVARLTLPVVVP
jgi:signal transduction histidine kinase